MYYCELNRENLLEEMLQEPDEVSVKRKRARETLRVLQQAFRVQTWSFTPFLYKFFILTFIDKLSIDSFIFPNQSMHR